MIDVAIIGARADQARLAALAKVLEARGFSVSVGDGSEPGATTILAWTQASVKDTKLHAAAASAGDRLIAVFLDSVQAPPEFAERGGELLTTWPAISSQGSFERLVHRLETMTGRTATSSSAVNQTLLEEAAKISRAVEGRRRFWPRVAGAAGLLVLGLIGYTIYETWPKNAPPNDAQKVCEAAQLYCLSKDQVRTGTEEELVEFVLQNASKEAVEAGAEAKDPLSAGLLCLIATTEIKDALAAQAACKTASELGSPLGQLGLATLFEQGPEPLKVDEAAARALLSAAADAGGDVRAQRRLARMEHAAGNFEAARAQLNKCAPAGQLDCRFLLAFMMEKAQGGPANVKEAVRIYTEISGADDGHPSAMANLAYLYEVGSPPDIAQNSDEAMTLYRRAAVFEHPYALYKLGEFAEQGKLEGAGMQEALGYYREAATAGSEEAKAALARLQNQPQP